MLWCGVSSAIQYSTQFVKYDAGTWPIQVDINIAVIFARAVSILDKATCIPNTRTCWRRRLHYQCIAEFRLLCGYPVVVMLPWLNDCIRVYPSSTGNTSSRQRQWCIGERWLIVGDWFYVNL